VVKRVVVNLNGITIAYMMGTLNAFMAVLLSFGVTITQAQTAAVVAFVNAALVTLAHVAHRLGESENQQRNTPAAPQPAAPKAFV
jgi:hypothetical protein